VPESRAAGAGAGAAEAAAVESVEPGVETATGGGVDDSCGVLPPHPLRTNVDTTMEPTKTRRHSMGRG
jgi:hypothetical protein